MKNIFHLTLLAIFSCLLIPLQSIASESEEMTYCEWSSWFKYPQHNAHYNYGKDIYVRVDPKKYHDISYMELYVDGKYIRKETKYPYEWCKGSGNSDHYLRNLSPGKHCLKVKIKDKCGYVHYKEICIWIDGNGGENHNCHWKSWFKYPQHNGSYHKGKDVYVKVQPEKYQDIQWMELYIDGQFIRKETSYPYEWCKGSGNSDHHLRNMQPGTYKLKCRIKDKCGKYHEIYCTFHVTGTGGGTGGGDYYCAFDYWFQKPQANSTYPTGSNVYVKVNPAKYQDVEYMELYINNQYIRKETSYPYEWCKGSGNSDHQLRNMQPGTYTLKCVMKTKCGKKYEKYHTFQVQGYGGGGNSCNNDGYYSYPKHDYKTYSYGSDVYVRVTPDHHQDVAYVKLFLNGHFIRKESNYPYEWAKGSGNSDYKLRNMKKGTYKLKARIYDKCGDYKDVYRTFYIK